MENLRKREVKWYGWRPDLPDGRDFIFRTTISKPVPEEFDLRDKYPTPPCYDQGELGSCTGNALAFLLQFERRKLKLKDFTPSRLMIYYGERVMEGTVDFDAGAEIRDGIKVIAKTGSCDEKLWPYDIERFRDKPPAAAYRRALDNQALQYERVPRTPVTLKRAIVNGNPVVFGFTVYENFESKDVEDSGVLTMPKSRDSPLGGHAVVLVGYNTRLGTFTVRNSWGCDWGKDGYFTMPAAYVIDPGMASDFWIIRGVG